MAKTGFFAGWRRRHMVRVELACSVAAWFSIQLGAILLLTSGAPQWPLKALAGVPMALFPAVMITARTFEVTPTGLRPMVSSNVAEATCAGHRPHLDQVPNLGISAVRKAALRVHGRGQLAAGPRPQPAQPLIAATAAAPPALPYLVDFVPSAGDGYG